jgi:hypothetical protein
MARRIRSDPVTDPPGESTRTTSAARLLSRSAPSIVSAIVSAPAVSPTPSPSMIVPATVTTPILPTPRGAGLSASQASSFTVRKLPGTSSVSVPTMSATRRPNEMRSPSLSTRPDRRAACAMSPLAAATRSITVWA